MTASRGSRRGNEKKVSASTANYQPRYSGDSRNSGLPVVGIGASAGGLEAFTSLLKALPSDLDMAFVFVPHLDPSAKAHLRKSPPLDIHAGDPGDRRHAGGTEPLYVIPPNPDLTIRDSRLRLDQRDEPRSVNTAIDIFFRSLAADQGSNAIGVILSGPVLTAPRD